MWLRIILNGLKMCFESFEKHDFKFTMERPNSILGVVIDYDRKRRKVVFNMIEYIHKLKTLYKNYVGENPISVYVPIKDEFYANTILSF